MANEPVSKIGKRLIEERKSLSFKYALSVGDPKRLSRQDAAIRSFFPERAEELARKPVVSRDKDLKGLATKIVYHFRKPSLSPYHRTFGEVLTVSLRKGTLDLTAIKNAILDEWDMHENSPEHKIPIFWRNEKRGEYGAIMRPGDGKVRTVIEFEGFGGGQSKIGSLVFGRGAAHLSLTGHRNAEDLLRFLFQKRFVPSERKK